MTKLINIQEKKEQDENRDNQFVMEYVQNGGNATQAAIACGAKESSASTVGYRIRLTRSRNPPLKATHPTH